ncbi:hypothetical protein QUC31_010222 [Theobroma cacao]
MTQELSIPLPNSESRPGSESSTVISVFIADPYVLLRMTDGSILLLVGDLATCTVSINTPTTFEGSKKMVSACTLYHDKGPEPWLCKASTNAWLSTSIRESIDGADGRPHDQGDIYCVICYESDALEILDVPNFNCVFSVEKFASGRTHLVDAYTLESSRDSEKVINKSSEELTGQGRKKNVQNLKVVELAMQRWSLCDGSIVASTVLHNVSCNHGFINVTSQIPLRGTPHQLTYFAERNLYPIIVSVPNTTTKDNESLLAVGIAYIQEEDVAARGHVILFSIASNTDNPQNLVKNFILLGDVHNSLYFLSRNEQGAQLSLLAKDLAPMIVFQQNF